MLYREVENKLKTHDSQLEQMTKLIYKKQGVSWADSIQYFEDEASAIYNTLGIKITLQFPTNVVIEIDKTINKKSGIDWVGNCKIKRNSLDSSTLFALIVANEQNNFKINGITFENLEHTIAYPLTTNWSIYKRNCCIHTYKCENFEISDCYFTKYSEGVVNTACKKYSILNNYLNSNVEEKNISQFLDDNYTDIAGSQTGDICGWVLPNEANLYNEDFIISNNKCLSVGLRIGIEVMTQSATHSRGIITGNIVKGLHQGIKLYKGSYGTLENAITNIKQCIISNNQVSYCREMGIYIRANLGVLCNGNFVTYCGLVDKGAGSPMGGILTRISAESTDLNSTTEAGNLIIGNYVYNIGKNVGIPVYAFSIHSRNSNCTIIDNMIVNDSAWLDKKGTGIYVGSGDIAEGSTIKNNKIINFEKGILSSGSLYKDENEIITIEDNTIKKCITCIECFGNSDDTKRNQNHIVTGNILILSDIGISIRSTKNSIIERNILKNLNTGILLNGGTYEDNISRTNPTNIVRFNTFTKVTKTHDIKETVSGDVSFAGRCKYWGYDLVEGVITPSI